MNGLHYGLVVECKCDDWRLHSEDIFRAQIAYYQDHGAVWRGGVFKFCPWCGKRLESISHDKVMVKHSANTAFTNWETR